MIPNSLCRSVDLGVGFIKRVGFVPGETVTD